MEKRGRKDGEKKELKSSYAVGIIALVFLIIGYQAAVFIHRTAVLKILQNRDRPDTVYVVDEALALRVLERAGVKDVRRDTFNFEKVRSPQGKPAVAVRQDAVHERAVEAVREKNGGRKVESFEFDPNEIPVEGLVRLGFSEKQAAAIDNYRRKGGRFRRKSDFAKSFVVADSVYRRLEPFIRIPLTDLNLADSAAFDALPGIGGYYAAAILRFRESLGGSFSYPEQLMDIRGFDREKFDGLSDLICIDPSHVQPFRLWTMPADSLRLHPYIGSYSARGIVLFRENNPVSSWTVEALAQAGILAPGMQEKLERCLIEKPGRLNHVIMKIEPGHKKRGRL